MNFQNPNIFGIRYSVKFNYSFQHCCKYPSRFSCFLNSVILNVDGILIQNVAANSFLWLKYFMIHLITQGSNNSCPTTAVASTWLFVHRIWNISLLWQNTTQTSKLSHKKYLEDKKVTLCKHILREEWGCLVWSSPHILRLFSVLFLPSLHENLNYHLLHWKTINRLEN